MNTKKLFTTLLVVIILAIALTPTSTTLKRILSIGTNNYGSMVLDKRCPVDATDWQTLIEFLGAGDGLTAFYGGRNRYHCSYVIYTDGTYYYGENGTTGELDYGGSTSEGGASGTIAAEVIQACIDALLASPYGLIFIKAGTYPITATIELADYIHMIGEGQNATILQKSGLNDVLLSCKNSGTAALEKAYVADIEFDGNSETGNIIEVSGWYTTFHRVEVHHTTEHGIRFITGGASNDDNAVIGSHVHDCDQSGIYSTCATTKIWDTMVGACGRNGIAVDGFSQIVARNKVFDCGSESAGWSCIRFTDAPYSICSLNRIEPEEADTNAIGIDGTSQYVSCVGNRIRNDGRNAFRLDDVSDITMSGNVISVGTFERCVHEDGTPTGNIFTDNIVAGTFSVATMTVTTCKLESNRGYNPVGNRANPFDNANALIELSGVNATPIASTDYTVLNCDIKISSTDSGNTDCAIMLKDPSGNNILQATLSTIEEMYIPEGFQITWGAFTGAAPTVTVSYN